MNSYYIKTVLMEYWRFKRQCLCADEVGYGYYQADVIVLTKSNFIHEIEVKCSKSDLCSLELKKNKHIDMTKKFYPHYFSFAVPTELVEDAIGIIEKLNPKYGLIEINSKLYPPIIKRKSAKRLHNNIDNLEEWKHKIIYRLNSALIGYMQRTHTIKGDYV
jgi:hypothetical protein